MAMKKAMVAGVIAVILAVGAGSTALGAVNIRTGSGGRGGNGGLGARAGDIFTRSDYLSGFENTRGALRTQRLSGLGFRFDF